MEKQYFCCITIWVLGITGVLSQAVTAKPIGGESPKCATCACACSACSADTCPPVSQQSDTSSTVSQTEGNVTEKVNIATTRSSTGPTLNLSLIYNSYNADGSRATVDTVAGYGWTHSYNIFLFSQLGAMFRFDGAGRVTRYKLGLEEPSSARPVILRL
jgi:hypothetical protein